MIWPETLNLQFISRKTGDAIKNLVVYLRIQAPHKNNYSIGPLISDENGMVSITKEAMKGAIEAAQKRAPMDYVDSLEDCTGIEVQVDSRTALRERVQRIEQFYPNEANNLRNLMQKRISNDRVEDVRKKIDVHELSDLNRVKVNSVDKN